MSKRVNKSEASGRFLLRIDPGLHAALRRSAASTGLSLNDYCARKLAVPMGALVAWQDAIEVVMRASSIFGDALIGVVAFGSWSRDELNDGSDIDILVVVEDRIALRRSLYRRWDSSPIEWRGHAVEPHFVHLPEQGRTVAGLWAEVAIDGVVLFTRSLDLPRRLTQVRKEIASGRIVRRTVHGQSYWVEAA